MKTTVALATLAFLSSWSTATALDPYWTVEELELIAAASIDGLLPLKPDKSNRVGDLPLAAQLGSELFADTRFSANGLVSCASCHMADNQFQDGLPAGHGIGDGNRRTMALAGASYNMFFFWDGRKDSQWSQALGPLENPVEHGADRTMIVKLIAANYRADYEAVFGSFPELGSLPEHAMPGGTPDVTAAWDQMTPEQQNAVNTVFSNMGKAIAAFERTIAPPRTRFDAYAAALAANDADLAGTIFTEQESSGLRLFLGNGDCVRCHAGPQFTDTNFHNIALPKNSAETDAGLVVAAEAIPADPFNRKGDFSDAGTPRVCLKASFMQDEGAQPLGAFKTPPLRGVSQRPPFMHTGQFTTIHDVLVHYNDAPKAAYGIGELPQPLKLTEQQLLDLEAFLLTLNVEETAAAQTGVPPLKWSTNWDMLIPISGGPRDGWEARQARRHRAEAAAS